MHVHAYGPHTVAFLGWMGTHFVEVPTMGTPSDQGAVPQTPGSLHLCDNLALTHLRAPHCYFLPIGLTHFLFMAGWVTNVLDSLK
jgi:hypothetical protein